jgi:hypothetical protein
MSTALSQQMVLGTADVSGAQYAGQVAGTFEVGTRTSGGINVTYLGASATVGFHQGCVVGQQEHNTLAGDVTTPPVIPIGGIFGGLVIITAGAGAPHNVRLPTAASMAAFTGSSLWPQGGAGAANHGNMMVVVNRSGANASVLESADSSMAPVLKRQ